ncbi:GDP-mannose:cellobiosyl-diphosphopolyprenol alpha-mannosyltransferase [Planctomycetes bacterium CA13]|uniref:GDP-mannose:cellobiosyl-diphosphopolyprenol alpha-mannosyltransferase n=1 Tax=Novipirellula herctigrandis TaxID=2527986 RepID=A0A5C5Z925_9BACT|nr:GDP-mannose:cellobiosyl-diphosphopolyprenol alpha-mannosyltransferase [Planctomycetes bacterium CA13]
MLTIINLVDDLTQVNFGIWNAAISTSPALKDAFGIRSEVWCVSPVATEIPSSLESGVDRVCFVKSTKQNDIDEILRVSDANSNHCLVVSHGCWQGPTRLGFELKKRGFKWIYTPHGMLEPWSVSQKRLRKKAYFHFIEGPRARAADIVRAVSAPESIRLRKYFEPEKIQLFPNGIELPAEFSKRDPTFTRFLFLGRLHHKKGVVPLVHAFLQSCLNNRADVELVIAGTDDGEKANLECLLNNRGVSNVKLLGPTFGSAKDEILQSSDFFVLPSFSEGFPTAVVEAMGFGCIPLISEGCNFPEAFEAGLAIGVEPERESIHRGLNEALGLSLSQRQIQSQKVAKFIEDNYTLDQIAASLNECYRSLLTMHS